MKPCPFTSVTRWLLVVFGCAVLATAQPMSSTPPAEPAPRSSDTLIYPQNSPEKPAAPSGSSATSGSGTLFTLLGVLACLGGVWFVFQKRTGGILTTRGARKLQIEETRPLGNRQHLIVADYDGQKFLLGVTPGQIQFLTHLHPDEDEEKKQP